MPDRQLVAYYERVAYRILYRGRAVGDGVEEPTQVAAHSERQGGTPAEL